MARIPFTISFFSLYIPLCRCSSSSGLLSNFVCHASVMHCDSIVAMAAPLIPHPSRYMNTGARIIFITTVRIVAYIACLGCPEALSAAFMPKYMWVTGLPMRITIMKSRAKGNVALLAPKKKRISSRNRREIAANITPTTILSVTRLPRIFFADS